MKLEKKRLNCSLVFLFGIFLLGATLTAEGLHGQDIQGANFWYTSRRLMIGSTMPTCTYNECRRCKYRCIAEQIPVEGNDPINSAYHYRCVCRHI
uniref:Stomagen C-terminal domain-containing protein n=1 Tax=Kalanchoe fedtschenkoi TaxID=63787 RepID=A0A7N0TRX9_KALFE